MPISTTEAFAKRHVTRDDGVDVLPRKVITVAALEAGYCLSSPTVNDAMGGATYPDQMTAEEFAALCEKNKSAFMSAEDMAKSVVVVAPSGVITRGSLEEIIKKSNNKGDALSEDEVEALFTTLDTDNKGAITAEDFMRSLYGDEGAFRLAERRKLDTAEAERRKEEAAGQELARKEKEENDRRKGAAAEAKRKEEEERQKAEAAKKAASGEKKDSNEKKKKASACC
ncbi:putative mitochondrial I/6 autoantigen-like protein [Leptomonas pyrrhocoris]|uniref:Putative mitochondrial I/6 autoantigen-like protein n=1 Tax=Leptomonas pyrrhocoris TaxID=157538 RepID=A0A0N0VHF9_LEPPY|nr:putative mitochondrial I/6 autoantigen-like protein [Leptomonas pyrrhocoris]KPA85801.1 putative mitochondrial I/6 autoantigen-like protein [Leptomonas pyrrhocoris]|eukprot:XP_015664240.1 putative mitochondrial I/6 autoantigen-like protein [Leptomonas pyrrhocoris]